MRTPKMGLIGLAAGLATLAPSAALAFPDWNRDLESIAAWPDGGGRVHVYAAWTANTESTASPRNLSTLVELYIGGSLVTTVSYAVTMLPGSGGGCGRAPCEGTCGSFVLNGVQASLLCFKDGACSPSFCECDCGTWVLTDLGIRTPAMGAEIKVVLRPAPGSLQEQDTSDDAMSATWIGRPIGWDRRIDTIALTETGGGRYDVHALGAVEWETPAMFFSLDLLVELRVNGQLRGTLMVPVDVESFSGRPCTTGCVAACGYVNGVPRYCAAAHRWECACGGSWLTTFEDVPLAIGDLVDVRVRSGPGAMPSLPDTDNDDVSMLPCCGTTGVDGSSTTPTARLEQNRPNPFNPLTSISFEIEEAGPVEVQVFDANGRLVAALLRRTLTPGRWSVTWDGRNAAGEEVVSGTYVYRLTTPRGSETRRMTLLK